MAVMTEGIPGEFERYAPSIRSSREFLTRLWHLENDDRPAFLLGYTGPRMRGGTPVRSALFSTEGVETVRERLLDAEKFYRAQMEEITGQLLFRGDFVPCLCPALGVIGIPSAFGCEVIWWERDFPGIRPIPAAGSLLFGAQPPSAESGELKRVLEYTKRFGELSGGALPIRLADIQGPLDSAGLIVGHSNLLGALVDRPAEAHRVLCMVTELTIEFVKRQRSLVRSMGVEFVPSMFQPWMPDGFGISVANDECVMISSELHDEFSVPYLNMLSEEFGGIYVHSCGDWRHQIPSLQKVHRLRGVEFGASETPFEDVARQFAGTAVLACRIGLHRDLKFDGVVDFVRRIRAAAPTNRGLFIHVDITNGILDDTWPVTDVEELYRLLDVSPLE